MPYSVQEVVDLCEGNFCMVGAAGGNARFVFNPDGVLVAVGLQSLHGVNLVKASVGALFLPRPPLGLAGVGFCLLSCFRTGS